MSTDWSHQVHGVSEIERLMAAGVRRICLTSPTRGGKSRMVQRVCEWGRPTLILCHRSMLFEQWAQGFDDNGLPFGLLASGYAPSVFENVQLGMIQTIERRWSKGRQQLPDAEIVFVDEIHAEKGARMQNILNEYVERGATIILVTATPVGLKGLADELIIAGCNSELRKLGVLVPVKTFAPDEPDIKSFKGQTKGLLQFQDGFKEVMLPVIFGRVIEHYRKINPDQRPSILFAPGVDESKWFCEQFNNAGIPWSHIDSKTIIINGHEMAADRENRKILLKASRTGETKGISNRFVLREGIDLPWASHMILACTFGSVQSYIQAGGRPLGQYFIDGEPQLTHVTCQDHGGNFHRFDSLNADRDWSLDDTDASLKEKRETALREKKESEPIVCPKCSAVRRSGPECPSCKFVAKGRRRMVVQTDGTLKEIHGDIYKPRKVNNSPESHKQWKSCVYRCKAKGMNFNQARGLFLRETGTVPGADFPMMPKMASDWAIAISKVPGSRLTGSAME